MLTLERVTKGQWAVLLSLAGIIVFSVFYLKVPELYSQVVTILLSTILVLILLIIRDLQNLRLAGELLVVESGQEVLEFIGKPRYYNEKYIKDHSIKIPSSVKQYRLGLHKPGEEFKIKLVKR